MSDIAQLSDHRSFEGFPVLPGLRYIPRLRENALSLNWGFVPDLVRANLFHSHIRRHPFSNGLVAMGNGRIPQIGPLVVSDPVVHDAWSGTYSGSQWARARVSQCVTSSPHLTCTTHLLWTGDTQIRRFLRSPWVFLRCETPTYLMTVIQFTHCCQKLSLQTLSNVLGLSSAALSLASINADPLRRVFG